ncbi:MAG: ACP S-malonyltransferase [Deltaproteobacteria bacterium]|nr:ACP S-malonyltransferase [Deltaproteobacteria bacterium]MBW2165690.1 ACP S-malonyltransferase [Deltaproteobacteria bacterium]
MMKTAFLFPGQGSQSVGMGLDFYQEFDFVRELVDMAEEITRINISRLCFKGPMEDLTMTVNLQSSITAVNLACLAILEKEDRWADIAAGHSLGEYSALTASGVISKEDTLRLVFKRGELMHRESTKHQGAMHAIIGLAIDEVQRLVDEVQSEGVVAVANHNTEHQIVITGTPEQVEKVSSLAVLQEARAVPLKVSGAWHSELIKGAVDEFRDFLDTVSFNTPERAIIHNVTAYFGENPDEIRHIMARQLCSPVRWYDSMQRLIDEKVEIFAEVGPGRVLTGLLKKILPDNYPCRIYNINSLKNMEKFLKET